MMNTAPNEYKSDLTPHERAIVHADAFFIMCGSTPFSMRGDANQYIMAHVQSLVMKELNSPQFIDACNINFKNDPTGHDLQELVYDVISDIIISEREQDALLAIGSQSPNKKTFDMMIYVMAKTLDEFDDNHTIAH